MSEIIKKLTSGVTQTGSKVKSVFDVNCYKVQIVQKKGDVEKEFFGLGKLVYTAYLEKLDAESIKGIISENCQKIIEIQNEIAELDAKIKDAKNLKVCPCGEVIAKEKKYCSFCGYKFKDTAV